MKVVVFYAKLHPATEWSVKKWAPEARFVDTSKDDYEYWRAIKREWTGEEDFVIIEQDIEITSDVIPSFIKCYEPWCVYEYEMGAANSFLRESFGCTKFSAQLQRMVSTDEICPGDHVWGGLDIVLSQTLKRYNERFQPYAKKQGGYASSHCHGRLMHHHRYRANPLTIRDGVQPQGTLHQGSECKWCGPHIRDEEYWPGYYRPKAKRENTVRIQFAPPPES